MADKTKTAAQSVVLFRSLTANEDAILDKGLPATYSAYRTIRKHPTVALARAFAIAPVVAAEWSIDADDPDPARPNEMDERVRFIQDQLMPLRDEIVQIAMEGRIDYGWCPFEKVFEVRKWEGRPRTMLKKAKALLVDLTDIRVKQDTGAFNGFYQPGIGITPEVSLDPEFALLIFWDGEGCNYYGRPLLENIRRTHQNWEDANAGAERYDKKMAGAQWAIHYPDGSSKVGGVDTDNATVATNLVGNLEASGSIIVPRRILQFVTDLNQKLESDAWKIELIEHQSKQGSFIERMAYCDKMFARGMLFPERAILEGEFGTKAEATVHANLALTQRGLEHRRITRFINLYLVNQLLAINYGEDAKNSVRLVASPLEDKAIAFFREVYKLLLAHPTASADAIEGIDLDGLTDLVGVPKGEEIVDDATAPGAPGGGTVKPLAGTDIIREMGGRIRKLYEIAAGGNGG